ncbi:uncharacterized protein ISCGN_004934 [Ixodes scapularis]
MRVKATGCCIIGQRRSQDIATWKGVPQHAFGAHHTLDRRQAPGQAPRARPGFRLVRARLRSSTTSTTAAPDDYYYYEVPEESQTAPPPPPSRFRGRVVARTRGRPPQKSPGANPIPPPPSYEEELAHYGYNFGASHPGGQSCRGFFHAFRTLFAVIIVLT